MPRRAKPAVAVIPLLLLSLVLSCAPAEENTPGAAVQAFFDHLNSGRTDQAKSMYDAEAAKMFADPAAAAESGFDEWVETETQGGTIRKVAILDSSITGDEAIVDFRLDYSDGTDREGQVTLSLEDGQWKLGLIH